MFIIIEWIGILLIAIIVNEFLGYTWHRLVAHWGYGGDTLRKTHYEHHIVWYPHDDLQAKEYRIKGFLEGDSWPWLVPAAVLAMFYGYLGYAGYLSKEVSIFLIVWLMIHIYIISYIHDSYHITGNWLNQFRMYQQHKKLHNLHHYFNCNYGISNYVFDWLFGTLVTEYNDDRMENIFPGFVYTDPKIERR